MGGGNSLRWQFSSVVQQECRFLKALEMHACSTAGKVSYLIPENGNSFIVYTNLTFANFSVFRVDFAQIKLGQIFHLCEHTVTWIQQSLARSQQYILILFVSKLPYLSDLCDLQLNCHSSKTNFMNMHLELMTWDTLKSKKRFRFFGSIWVLFWHSGTSLRMLVLIFQNNGICNHICTNILEI